MISSLETLEHRWELILYISRVLLPRLKQQSWTQRALHTPSASGWVLAEAWSLLCKDQHPVKMSKSPSKSPISGQLSSPSLSGFWPAARKWKERGESEQTEGNTTVPKACLHFKGVLKKVPGKWHSWRKEWKVSFCLFVKPLIVLPESFWLGRICGNELGSPGLCCQASSSAHPFNFCKGCACASPSPHIRYTFRSVLKVTSLILNYSWSLSSLLAD